LTTVSDDTLLQRARQGDQRAFAALVERYETTVRGIIHGMLGGDNEADDIAQEVFIRFYRSLDQFRGQSQLGTYLGRIAINTALTALEKRKKRRWLAWDQWAGTSKWEQADHHADPGRGELRDSLNKALARLSPDHRAVVVLRLVEGFSVAETAAMLQLPPGTVASRLARAQQQLRTLLTDVRTTE
jgi:RNA polymerase sigma-70 factor (ECF subfamily)